MRLEIGGGTHPLSDFEQLDTEILWGTDPLPYKNDTITYIYTSHCLEHIPWWKTKEALQECFRILKPDGILEIWVPDFNIIMDVALNKIHITDEWWHLNPDKNTMCWVNGKIFRSPFCGEIEDNRMCHQAVFTEEYLKYCLENCGFNNSQRIIKRTKGYNHGIIDLGIQTSK